MTGNSHNGKKDAPVLVFDLDDTLYPECDYVRSGFAAVDRWLREHRGVTGFSEIANAHFRGGRRGNIFDLSLEELGLPRDPALVSRITGVEGADMVVAFLKAPGHTIELIEYRAPAGKGAVKARPCDTGFAHIAFNVDDAAAAVAAAERYGVKPVAPPVAIDQGPNKGRRVVYVRDWDGVTLEFIEAAAR